MQTIVYIDGQNFLYKVSERLIANNLISNKQEITKIDIPALLRKIIPEENMEFRYYGVTKVKRQEKYGERILNKSITFADSLRKLRTCLANTGVDYRRTGALMVRETDPCRNCGFTGYKFQEKGVDVGLAVDIVRDVYEKKVGHVVLVSSDTDLIPAIKIAKKMGIKVTYIAFDNQITVPLWSLASATQVIRDHEVIEAFKRLDH